MWIGIAIRASDLDADPRLFNVRNGTMDLRTGVLREHRRQDLITRVSPVSYVAESRTPVFTGFLERVLPDPEVRSFVDRFFGYSLTGLVREHTYSRVDSRRSPPECRVSRRRIVRSSGTIASRVPSGLNAVA